MNGPTRASVLTWHRAIAAAVCEVLEDQVLEAWRYLDSWASLARAGVPGAEIRHALDREPVPTQAGEAVANWTHYGARGCLVLCDAKDSGKTFACVRWAHARHADGDSTMWIVGSELGGMSLDEQRALFKRAMVADGLVLDDLGAGVTTHEGVHTIGGGYMRKQLEGLLHARGQRPTLVTSNMNEAETAAFLGPKITSRQEQAGGIVRIERERQLRELDTEDADPKTGRGERWRQARALVDAIGCERVRRWLWDDDMIGGKYDYAFDVGRVLEVKARRGAKAMRALVRDHGLDREAIRLRAVTIADQIDEDEKIGRLEQQQLNMALARRADNTRRADTCYRALAKLTSRPAPPPRRQPKHERLGDVLGQIDGLDGSDWIVKLESLGFRVRQRATGFAVYYVLPPAKDGTTPPAPALKLTGLPTKHAAWDAARGLL